MTEEDEHYCMSNLSTQENEIIIESATIYVYRDCTICGEEFEQEFEYVDTRPA